MTNIVLRKFVLLLLMQGFLIQVKSHITYMIP